MGRDLTGRAGRAGRRGTLAGASIALVMVGLGADAGTPVFRGAGVGVSSGGAATPPATGGGSPSGPSDGSTGVATGYVPTPDSQPSDAYQAAVDPLTVTPYAGFVDDVVAGSIEQASFAVSGGSPPYAFSRPSPLPGESFQGDYGYATLSGAFPVGSYPATPLVVTDSAGATTTVLTDAFAVVAAPATPIVVTLRQAIPSTVPSGSTVTEALDVAGGVPPYSIASSGTPAGVVETASATGDALSGAPADGAYGAITTLVTDSIGQTASYASTPFTVRDPSIPAIVVAPLDYFQLGLPTTAAPGQYVNAYFSVSGGDGRYAIAVTPALPGGSVPSVSGAAYVGFAAPDQPGTLGPYTITVTDDAGLSGSYVTNAVAVTAAGPAAQAPLAVQARGGLPSAIGLGTPVDAVYDVTGGSPPYTVSFAGLPAGLSGSLGVDGGGVPAVIVLGSPTTLGANPATAFTVTDAAGASVTAGTAAFAVTEPPLQVLAFVNLPAEVNLGDPVDAEYEVVGGVAPYEVSFGPLAPGLAGTLAQNPPGGSSRVGGFVEVAGAPTTLGVAPGATFVVTDATGATTTFTTSSFRVDPAGTNAAYQGYGYGGAAPGPDDPGYQYAQYLSPRIVPWTPYPGGYQGFDGSETGTGYANTEAPGGDDQGANPQPTPLRGAGTVAVSFAAGDGGGPGLYALNQVPGSPIDQGLVRTYAAYGNNGPHLTGGTPPYADLKVTLGFDPRGWTYAIQPDGWGFILATSSTFSGSAYGQSGPCTVTGRDATGASFKASGTCLAESP